MADSRPGGIEKIAHLFIAGHGASALRARDNSGRHWANPASPPVAGTGQAADGQAIPPASMQAAAEQTEKVVPGAEAVPEEPAGVPEPVAEPAAPAEESAVLAETPPTSPKPAISHELHSLLVRAKVVAVLTGHMGPLAGPAAEAVARGLARENARVAMLYGPAEYACLHQFASGQATGLGSAMGVNHGGNGNGQGSNRRAIRTCDMLLLPDWVFQFDLWPAERPVWSIAVGYGAGSEGLMAAYGALKGLIARFGRPDEVLVLPFGCNEQEEAWVGERLAEMCQRFLDLVPRTLGQAHPELRVQGGPLQPIAGGIDGVKSLLESIGKVRLSVVKHPNAVSSERNQSFSSGAPSAVSPSEDAAGPCESIDGAESAERHEAGGAEDVTILVPVEGVPRDGQAVLEAMLKQYGLGGDGADLDVWRRSSVYGTIVGSEGLIGAAHSTGDLLAFALWLCRQAQIGRIEELASITIAVRQADSWLIEAGMAMPVPVKWLTWHPYRLEDRHGVLFTAVQAALEE